MPSRNSDSAALLRTGCASVSDITSRCCASSAIGLSRIWPPLLSSASRRSAPSSAAPISRASRACWRFAGHSKSGPRKSWQPSSSDMRGTAEALSLISAFTQSPEEDKSRELILAMLEQTPAPFSRRQFHPGHITCTTLVLDPGRLRVLLVYHHRLHRWLLPGGHVEEEDTSLARTAQREAEEETSVRIAAAETARLVGM